MENIYLIQTAEFVLNDENVYKIGKTKQEKFKRFNSYKKDYKIHFFRNSNNCDKTEKEIIELLKKKYKQRKDIGTEYFEGFVDDIILDINNIIKNEKEENKIKFLDILNFDEVYSLRKKKSNF
jgi:hypothetical protein